MFLYYTGLNTKTIIAIKKTDYDFMGKRIMTNNDKNIPLPPKITKILDIYLNHCASQYLFFNNSPKNKFIGYNEHITEHSVQNIFNKYTTGYNISIRDLRNSLILKKLYQSDINIYDHKINIVHTKNKYLQIPT